MAGEVQMTIVAIDAASSIIKGITDSFGPLGTMATGAVGLVAGALTTMVTSGSEAQDVMTRFNSLVDSSPLRDYKQQLLDMANAYSLKTRYEDESIISAEAQLAIYTNIGKDAIPEVLKQTLNLAAFMKSDAPAAAQVMGRALQDIAGGSLTMLVRQRLLTKEQAETAKKMAETGDTAGAQAMVLEALDKKIGTLAEDMGTSFPGQMEIFGNALSNIAEDAGMKLLPALEPLIQKLLDLALKVAPVLVDWVANKIVPAVSAFVEWLLKLGEIKPPEFLIEFSQQFQALWAQIGPQLEVIGQQVMKALGEAAQQLGEKLKPLIQEYLTKLAEYWKEHGPEIIKIIQGLAQAFISALPAIVDVIGFLLKVSFTISEVFLGVSGAIISFTVKWHDFWVGVYETVKKWFQPVMDFIDQIKEAIASVGDWFEGSNAAASGDSVTLNYGGRGGRGGRASGGPVSAGGTYLIGERGPEIVRFGAAGYVTPNSALGGQTIYQFNFPNYVGSYQDLDIVMRQTVRNMQADGSVPR